MSVWEPLALGFLVTGVLVAFEDLAHGEMPDIIWAPATWGLFTYYSHFSFQFFGEQVLFPVSVVLTVFLANRWKHQKIASGDFTALALVSMWTVMGLLSIMGALLVGLVGRQLGFFKVGQRGIPLAGLTWGAAAFLSFLYLF